MSLHIMFPTSSPLLKGKKKISNSFGAIFDYVLTVHITIYAYTYIEGTEVMLMKWNQSY